MNDVAKAGLDLTPFYGLIGAVVVAQFGTIATVMVWVFKAGVYKGANDKEKEYMKRDINAAFKKIRGEPCEEPKPEERE